jgi:hypothetical protein
MSVLVHCGNLPRIEDGTKKLYPTMMESGERSIAGPEFMQVFRALMAGLS